MDPVETIAQNVRRLRKAQGKTQEDVALAADLPISTVGFVERQERVVSVRILARIAEALDVSLADLVTPHEN